jgi:hypothetical protein
VETTTSLTVRYGIHSYDDGKCASVLQDALAGIPSSEFDNQKEPKKRRQYTIDDVKGAVVMATQLDGDGRRLHTDVDASTNYGVPLRSLKRFKKEYIATGTITFKPLGCTPSLTAEDEMTIAKWANYRASINMALSRSVFCRAAGKVWCVRDKARTGVAQEWVPGKNWFPAFVQRMKDAGVPIILQRVTIRNKKAPTRVAVEEWFDKLRDALNELGFMTDEHEPSVTGRNRRTNCEW